MLILDQKNTVQKRIKSSTRIYKKNTKLIEFELLRIRAKVKWYPSPNRP